MSLAQYCTVPLRSSLYNDNEVVMSSFLIKRPTLSTSSLDEQNEATYNYPHHHNLTWKISHKYWCVLRKIQFSYYKDETERKPERVIPITDVLNCRVYEGTKMDLYTRDKTLRFEADDPSVIQMWDKALRSLINGDANYPGPETGIDGIRSPEFETEAKNANAPDDIQQHGVGLDDEEEDEDEDDGFDVVCETDAEATRRPPTAKDGAKTTDICSINNGGVLEEDKEFYESYNPKKDEQLIQSGLLYGQVRNSIRRKRWKSFKGELTNRQLRLVSPTTDKIYASINLDDVVDCVELDKSDPCFALIVTSLRLKFKAKNDDEMIDWIINIKSSVLVREKISNSGP
ncbi:HBL107Cp [Eremothecium sinecaudum]|uniref:HBL107Cp n=1 Tax=Eremothecium sinecaudum TaxID=45286 RepID=A0A120K0X9_9SACH|nr:HBL107Cp [Eremothecium sinecaudum]AMD18795.1 HBL107Cp [Eremothecium sinecaudum]